MKVEAVKVWPGGRRELRMTDPNNVVTPARAKSQLDKSRAVYVTVRDLWELERTWKPSKKVMR